MDFQILFSVNPIHPINNLKIISKMFEQFLRDGNKTKQIEK